tara:strand:+ start:59308 stop:60006 length:699 start_codon:yes stop_codon:yes gene_type:complete
MKIFNRNLKELLSEVKNEFHNNEPFEHLVIDNLFNEDILRSAREEIPRTRGIVNRYSDNNQLKVAVEGENLLQTEGNISKVLSALNSKEFVEFLNELTNINLTPDNTFRGAGIHHIPSGGKLGIHVDFSRPKWNPNIYRRANVLLYLNEEWEDSWGGNLELWDNSIKNGGKCIKSVPPLFNSLVIFGTKKESWHGHPHPLACPQDRARQSFAAYYYSEDPGDDLEIHSTIFN